MAAGAVGLSVLLFETMGEELAESLCLINASDDMKELLFFSFCG